MKQENYIWASSQNMCLRHYSELLRKMIKKASQANRPFLIQSDTHFFKTRDTSFDTLILYKTNFYSHSNHHPPHLPQKKKKRKRILSFHLCLFIPPAQLPVTELTFMSALGSGFYINSSSLPLHVSLLLVSC